MISYVRFTQAGGGALKPDFGLSGGRSAAHSLSDNGSASKPMVETQAASMVGGTIFHCK